MDIELRKGGKYLTRSGHVVIIEKRIDHVNFEARIMGVKIGNESFDFLTGYSEHSYYFGTMESQLDIIADISNEKADDARIRLGLIKK